jgi:hypothetical protein
VFVTQLLSEGKYFYSMTEAERRRLETILANRRIVPSKEILQRASTSTSDQSFKSDAKDPQAEEETEEDLMFINEFLPDEEHARELDDINQ